MKQDEREIVVRALGKYLKDTSKKCGDEPDYVAYLTFCILGGMIAEIDGEVRLQEYIRDIRKSLKRRHK